MYDLIFDCVRWPSVIIGCSIQYCFFNEISILLTVYSTDSKWFHVIVVPFQNGMFFTSFVCVGHTLVACPRYRQRHACQNTFAGISCNETWTDMLLYYMWTFEFIVLYMNAGVQCLLLGYLCMNSPVVSPFTTILFFDTLPINILRIVVYLFMHIQIHILFINVLLTSLHVLTECQ